MGNSFICSQDKSNINSKKKSSTFHKVNISNSYINSINSNSYDNSNMSENLNKKLNSTIIKDNNNNSNLSQILENKNNATNQNPYFNIKDNTNKISNSNNNICLNNRKYFFHDNKSMNFIVHRNDGMNDFIIEMNITKSNNQNLSKEIEFIMILDKSGSMGGEVHRLISRIIPTALNLLNYEDNHIIHLITFESNAYLYNLSVKDLKNNNNIIGSGGTCMANVYKLVRSIFNQNKNKSNFRILALSDGMIGDQEETKNQAEILKTFIEATDFAISAGSIRYNSGYGQPDTKALSSVLLLNTDSSKSQVLTEISSSLNDNDISQKIYELFKNDYFESNFILKSEKIKFRIDPWKEGKNEVKLNEGKNFVWADKNPSLENVGIYEGGKLKYKKEDFKNGYKINYSNYNGLLGVKLNMTARKVRINKTSGSKAALEENKKIIDYYDKFEKSLKDNKNKEARITNELKLTNELNINNYNNQQLAQFIGVESNFMPITQFLSDIIKIEEKDEKDIKTFVGNALGDGLMIDKAFEQLFN